MSHGLDITRISVSFCVICGIKLSSHAEIDLVMECSAGHGFAYIHQNPDGDPIVTFEPYRNWIQEE